jgi:RNA polymerase sigma-70 factor, ECF subfamily
MPADLPTDPPTDPSEDREAARPASVGPGRRVPAAFDEIIAAAADGDHAALSELFTAYQPMLLRYLRSRAADLADDVAGEVWLAVARNLGRFTGDESGFRSWLFTIARCRLIESQRKQTRRRTDPAPPDVLDDGTPELLSGRGDPAALVIGQLSARQAIDAIVAGLPPDQAEVVLLRIVAGLGVAEVAAVMGRSPSSVRVLCHRGLRQLRDRFPEGELVP